MIIVALLRHQPGDVRSEILIPSFSSSPWILGLPQLGFALAILRTSTRISLSVPERPQRPRFEICVQYSSNPFRCHRTTVSGLTTMRDSRHLCQTDERHAQKSRSLLFKRARGRFLFKIASCCRSERFSRSSSVRFFSSDFKNDGSEACPPAIVMSMFSMRTGFWRTIADLLTG